MKAASGCEKIHFSKWRNSICKCKWNLSKGASSQSNLCQPIWVCVCVCRTRWPLPVHHPHLARGFAVPNPKFQSSSNCLAIWPVKWPEGRTGGRAVKHFEYGIEKKKKKLKAISLWKRPYVCSGLITFKEQWRRRSRVCAPIMCECCQGLWLCLRVYWNILAFTDWRRCWLAFDVADGSGGDWNSIIRTLHTLNVVN